jgi:uncharacterized membrane protein
VGFDRERRIECRLEPVLVVAGALGGNLYEGMLGARRWLSHGWLNATNTLVGAGCAVILAWLLF